MGRSSSTTLEKSCKLNNGFQDHCFQKILINVQLLKKFSSKIVGIIRKEMLSRNKNLGISSASWMPVTKKITTLGGGHLLQFSDKLSIPKTSNFGNNRRQNHRYGVLMMTTFSSGCSISHASSRISPFLAQLNQQHQKGVTVHVVLTSVDSEQIHKMKFFFIQTGVNIGAY